MTQSLKKAWPIGNKTGKKASTKIYVIVDPLFWHFCGKSGVYVIVVPLFSGEVRKIEVFRRNRGMRMTQNKKAPASGANRGIRMTQSLDSEDDLTRGIPGNHRFRRQRIERTLSTKG